MESQTMICNGTLFLKQNNIKLQSCFVCLTELDQKGIVSAFFLIL